MGNPPILPMKGRLLLSCDSANSAFVLTKAGEDWRQRFSDLTTALLHASRLVNQQTPMTVYDQTNQVIVETSVFPRSPEN